MAFRFEGLDVWQMGKEYAAKVYAATAKFPRHEDYGLRSQMNRVVNSICLNIAEGSAKNSSKAFDYHLEIAVGSIFEVVAASCLAEERGYVSKQEREALYESGHRLAKSINAFRKTLC
ncbi:MAG: four helix bundle protein [Nitrospirae bacterium]|nr:MAG: four helix bundle protein [Nitrospirota bacterium]